MLNRNSRTTLLLGCGAAAAGLGALAAWKRSAGTLNLREKVVLITGGSRGLGLALARGFAEKGAQLVLCARSEEELDRARQDLAGFGRTPYTIVCDVTDQVQVQNLIDATITRYGQLDVLVNNAGLITVGPIDTMTVDDFERAMDVMFWGIVHTTLAALPHLRTRKNARIVNITSVGAKISVPHLVPYSCAKFAALAFSEGLRAELRGSGIKVVTIAPGLMRTGSYLNAEFKGADAGEPAWFALSSSLPGDHHECRSGRAANHRRNAPRLIRTRSHHRSQHGRSFPRAYSRESPPSS